MKNGMVYMKNTFRAEICKLFVELGIENKIGVIGRIVAFHEQYNKDKKRNECFCECRQCRDCYVKKCTK